MDLYTFGKTQAAKNLAVILSRKSSLGVPRLIHKFCHVINQLDLIGDNNVKIEAATLFHRELIASLKKRKDDTAIITHARNVITGIYRNFIKPLK